MAQNFSESSRHQQVLFIDADDTLWENNIYFERAIEEFVAYLQHSRLGPAEVRAALDEIELANLASQGFGATAFSRNLCQCFEQLCERARTPDDLRFVQLLGERILSQEIELIDGVIDTLTELATRHRLVLFTMGQADEQRRKIERSGISSHFVQTAIVPEKNTAAYQRLVTELVCDPAATWMIGNSPRSDINPALEAGLNAVYIPHQFTWHLLHQDLHPGPGRLLTLARFCELREHF